MPDINDYSAVYDFLFRLEKRISTLERDADYIEENIYSLDKNKVEIFNELTLDHSQLSQRIFGVKDLLKEFSIAMSGLSGDLKNSIKSDDVKKISEQVDSIPLNEFMTKKDVKEMND